MLFTEGKDREYERMMQQKPQHDRRPIKTMKERDCEHSLYFADKDNKCSLAKSTVFND